MSLKSPIKSQAKDTGAPTWHWQALQTSYVSTAGNFVGSASFPVAKQVTSRFFVTGVDVQAANTSAIVAFGDSITDGSGSTVDAHERWPDHLAARLGSRHAPRRTVLNHGIAGGRLLFHQVGTGALARFDRDVIAQPGAKFVIVAIGINDIGIPPFINRPEEEVPAAAIVSGYRQLVIRGHEQGLSVYGATLTPIADSFYDTPKNEDRRQAVNDCFVARRGRVKVSMPSSTSTKRSAIPMTVFACAPDSTAAITSIPTTPVIAPWPTRSICACSSLQRAATTLLPTGEAPRELAPDLWSMAVSPSVGYSLGSTHVSHKLRARV